MKIFLQKYSETLRLFVHNVKKIGPKLQIKWKFSVKNSLKVIKRICIKMVESYKYNENFH